MIRLAASRIFDGTRILTNHSLLIHDGRIAAVLPSDADTPPAIPMACPGGIVMPGFIDLQVNGGMGLMVDGATDHDALARLHTGHRAMGTAAILPTLISDTPKATTRVIEAAVAAARNGTPGLLGLHLEGPHLDPRRKGAHDAALLRPMTGADLAQLVAAAQHLPVLMVTLAPEQVTPDQIAALAQAGVIVSLGHSDCDLGAARAAFAAGARAATHLFNAMSQMSHRAPGLTGAVLSGATAAGLIADGIHVDPAALRVALAARPEGLFLVTDCMAVAGTTMDHFTLNGRTILRAGGALRLACGTLAGADLCMDRAIATLIREAGCPPERAMAMATRIPADLVGAGDRHGVIAPGRAADLVWLDDDYTLQGVWTPQGWQLPKETT